MSNQKSVLIGGGGFCRNLDVHADGSMITGVDVYGAYIGSTIVGTVWRQLVTITSMPFFNGFFQGGGVMGAKMAPLNSNIIVMSYTPYQPTQTTIVLSQDKGRTWVLTNFGNYSASPNGSGQGQGGTQPLIAIDPANSNVCYVGTELVGLWVTTNLLSGNPIWSQVSASSFPTASGIGGVIFDPTSGITGGKTNRIVVAVYGSGLWYTNNTGTSWTGPVTSSYTNPGKCCMGGDGTFYIVTNDGSMKVGRFTSANTWTDISVTSDGFAMYDFVIDPNNPNRGIADGAGGYFNISTNMTASPPTWNGQNGNHKVLSPTGQPLWAQNSNDAYLTEGKWWFDPLKTTSATSNTISAGTFSWTDVPTGLNIVVGDCIRAFQTGSPNNFIQGYVTVYSGNTLTIATVQTSSTTSHVAGDTGSLTWTVGAGLSFVVGTQVVVQRTSDQFTTFTGTVISYSGTTLTVNVTKSTVGGAGTFTDWTINQGSFGGSGTISSWTITKDRVWFAMGLGVLWTDNPLTVGQQWWNAQFNGIENLVANQVVWPPGGVAFGVCWDRPFWYFADMNTLQANYHPAYPTYGSNNVIFGASADWASGNPSYIFGLNAPYSGGASPDEGGYSTDGGVTWNNFAAAPPPAIGPNGGGGTVAAADATHVAIVRSSHGGMYYTLNGGTSWTEAIISGVQPGNQISNSTNTIAGSGTKTWIMSPAYTTRALLNYQAGWLIDFFESTGSSGMSGTIASYDSSTGSLVVTITSSFGSGTFASWISRSSPGWGNNSFNGSGVWMCSDRVNIGTYYAFNDGVEAPGIYRSTDNGQTWALRFSGTITGDNHGNPQIKAVPNLGSTSTAGHLFLTGGGSAGAPLYRSTDGGLNLTTVANVEQVTAMGFGAPKSGSSYPSVYIFGNYNGLGIGFYRSDDNCASFNFICSYLSRENISPGSGGWIDDVTCLEGNPNIWNSFIVGYQGSSFAWIDSTQTLHRLKVHLHL